ncbi:hypothetical protein CPB97_002870 [Podila verticillata]|nr:hypothetical protein CPB97_002870 [Podila verticillata]
MYVQLTIKLITKAIQLFCKEEIKEKEARKICKSLAKDDELEKHYFCGTTCTKSKHICMKEVDDDEDDEASEDGSVSEDADAKPHKKRHSKKHSKKVKKNKSKKSKVKEIVESSEEDEGSVSEDDDAVPHKKKHSKKHSKMIKKSKAKEIVQDIPWTKYDENKRKFRKTAVEAPSKKEITWKRCSFDNAHMYATNYCLDGNYLFKMYKTDTIVALLWKLPSRDDTAYCRQKYFPEKYKQVLLNMGYTVDELPLDYKPYLHEDLVKTKVALHVQGQTEDDVASEVDVPSKKHSKKHKQVA